MPQLDRRIRLVIRDDGTREQGILVQGPVLQDSEHWAARDDDRSGTQFQLSQDGDATEALTVIFRVRYFELDYPVLHNGGSAPPSALFYAAL